MAKTAANAPVTVAPGGDSYLNDARTKALCAQALKARPDADLIELDATSADQYAFDEAVSPSLLSDVAVVKLVNLQNADDKLAEALVTYTKQAAKDPNGSSVVICQHEGGVKGRKIIDQLVKAGARKEDVPDLKKPMHSSISCSENSRNVVVESNRWPHSSWYPCSAAKPANSPPCASNCVSTLTIIRWASTVSTSI